jgi:hypothetical protein
MRNILNVIRQKFIAGVIPEGKIGMTILGHRYYVGGMWDVNGKLQFDFLVQEGLKPEHSFLDVGCGSLRGGLYFIKYLDPGNYLGIDKEKKLIKIGIKKELGEVLLKEKRPEFLISDKFEFE